MIYIGSDHRPNLNKSKRKKRPGLKRKTFWNYRKAKWLEYARATNEGFDKIDITNGTID